MVTTAGPELEFPADVDGVGYVRPLWHGAWRAPAEHGGAFYRRAITEDSPVRFALTYVPHLITDRHTRLISFSHAHLAMADAALCWMRPEPGLDGWVMPRGFGKTTWTFTILPLWALSHGHRRFALGFARTDRRAAGHLAKLRRELRSNRKLLGDFPHLAIDRGVGRQDSAHSTRTIGGAQVAAHGLDSATLGITSDDNDRPDLILGTDLEPPAAKHTPAEKARVESLLTSAILPMGDRTTRTWIEGTTTMHGSLMHDVVRAALPVGDPDRRVAGWIDAHQLQAHYWPPILDEGTPAARSLWPQRWPLHELERDRDAPGNDWALNMANRPEQAGQRGYWVPGLIRYDRRGREIVRRVVYVDWNMTKGANNDQTAIVMVGLDRSGRYAVVEFAEAAQFAGVEVRDRLDQLTHLHPRTLREWIIETTNGGDRLVELLTVERPLPYGVTLDTDQPQGNKPSRIQVALGHYQRGAVEHARALPQLEAQQESWTPAATADDLLDGLAGALRRLFPLPG